MCVYIGVRVMTRLHVICAFYGFDYFISVNNLYAIF